MWQVGFGGEDLAILDIEIAWSKVHARAAAAMRQMQGGSGTLVVSLPLFTAEEMRVFVESVLGDTAGVRKLAQVIWEITGGWPLYAEQVRLLPVR